MLLGHLCSVTFCDKLGSLKAAILYYEFLEYSLKPCFVPVLGVFHSRMSRELDKEIYLKLHILLFANIKNVVVVASWAVVFS